MWLGIKKQNEGRESLKDDIPWRGELFDYYDFYLPMSAKCLLLIFVILLNRA